MNLRFFAVLPFCLVAMASFGSESELIAELKYSDYAEFIRGNPVLNVPDATFEVWAIDNGGCGDFGHLTVDLVKQTIAALPTSNRFDWFEVYCQEESPEDLVLAVLRTSAKGEKYRLGGHIFRVPRSGTTQDAEFLGRGGCSSYDDYNLVFVSEGGRVKGTVCFGVDSAEEEFLEFRVLTRTNSRYEIFGGDRIHASLIREENGWSVLAVLEKEVQRDVHTLSTLKIGEGIVRGFQLKDLDPNLPADGEAVQVRQQQIEASETMRVFRRLTDGPNATEIRLEGPPASR